ncbi:MAG: Hsp70 family protein [Myxococcaceae bacterium]
MCDEALQSARLTGGDIDAVILVGGPTRLPIIRSSVRHYFQKDPMTGVDPDEVVALGAAIQGNALLNKSAAAWMLAPSATTWSGSISLSGSFWK